jgi:hypothetical protein
VATRLNIFAEELPSKPVSLPVFNLPPLDLETEIREAAAKVAERRVIRRGRDAWLAINAINRAESFESWQAIGAALAIGKRLALRTTGANDTNSRHYILWFSRWLAQNGFGRIKPKTRSWAIALHENAEAITAWRDSLPEQQRRRLINPHSIMQRWKATQGNGHRCSRDIKRAAMYAWRRFVSCTAQLPPADRIEMWAMVSQARVTDAAA